MIENPDDPYAAFANVGSENFESGKKVIYIAPMKALAQEVVEKFGQRLKVRAHISSAFSSNAVPNAISTIHRSR